jgi:RNA polymerase sigma factor (sigma-70 family)
LPAYSSASPGGHPANDNGRSDERVRSTLPTWLFADSAPALNASLDDLASLPDESAPDPDDQIERHRIAARVTAALSSLPETERRVVELHYYEELSFSEIGTKLGICKPWAFRLHNKALKQLKEKLAELSESDDADGNA